MSATDPSSAIETLGPRDRERIDQVAEMMFESFRELSPGWVPDLAVARAKVLECLEPGMLNRIRVVAGRVVGWVGARHDHGSIWELHPLVVHATVRRQGVGRGLVAEIERLVGERGALTMRLGTSDEAGLTNLSGVDLFLDPLGALGRLEATPPHPLGFWKAVGYSVVGVFPDAEGPGKPTILLAKRIGRPP